MAYSPAHTPQARALLDAATERSLARLIEQGQAAAKRLDDREGEPGDAALVEQGRTARQRFFEANIRLVLSIANRTVAPTHVDREDIIHDGMLGLDRAIDGFDWQRGLKFSTYATWWIRQSIQRGLEHTASSIRIPSHRTSEIQSWRRHRDEQLPLKLASIADLASIDSLDRPLGDDGGAVGDQLEATEPAPDDVVEHQATRDGIDRLLRRLDPVTARAIELRFGLDGGEPASYADIAEQLTMGAETVRRRVNRALTSMRPGALALQAA